MKPTTRFALLAGAAAVALPLAGPAFAQSSDPINDGKQAGRDEPAASATDSTPAAGELKSREVLDRERGEMYDARDSEDEAQLREDLSEKMRGAVAADEMGEEMPERFMRVADLEGRSVVGAGGEDLGEVAGVTRDGEDARLLIESGDFLGLDETYYFVPLSAVSMADEEVRLDYLTEGDLDRMREDDPEEHMLLTEDEEVSIRG
ncbi:PRC-barrel domain-containing protein [Albimonas pacifica]|uniref:PRC-barrel domain-containing protein n=1 Tax=Albimonas pacifica TaxID=1114924 RepID=A0A1I3GVM2_9RHOB|nr:PRC-barrel domain-containing protein [Albimonas pacifica]SFI27410.1 PRC-barrel domain-containing protein [Albimonas pacifica]